MHANPNNNRWLISTWACLMCFFSLVYQYRLKHCTRACCSLIAKCETSFGQPCVSVKSAPCPLLSKSFWRAMRWLEKIWKKQHHQVCYHLLVVQGLRNYHPAELVGAVDSACYDGDAQTHTCTRTIHTLASKNDGCTDRGGLCPNKADGQCQILERRHWGHDVWHFIGDTERWCQSWESSDPTHNTLP